MSPIAARNAPGLRAACALVLALFAAACGQENALDSTSDDLAPKLRVVAANLTSGNSQGYEGPGVRILQGLKPDVTLLQEFNVGKNSTAEIQNFVTTTFGSGFTYYREAATYHIPNGVISRYPIVASGSWADSAVPDRAFAWAKIQLPSKRFLWAISLHLHTSTGSHKGEAAALIADITKAIPTADLLVMGGDFNAPNANDNAVKGLATVVDTAGPYPADVKGNHNTNQNRNKTYDWVLADPELRSGEQAITIAGVTLASGFIADTRTLPAGALAPALQTDSGASNMQHMAVVRDFLMP
ncbi:MAG: endonuclease/exonuclease/phosphatase family protein [Deltaproteobacteria bacterium]|nr:endonuclease/exonuclease/phosphatase family protein [Deltaproteobacteria bacterium]